LPIEIPRFHTLLADLKPDIVHFHDFSIGASRLHLRAAKAAGARIVMSYHSPGQSCVQRSLLFRGRTPCDGRILRRRCTSCRLSAAGAPALLSDLIAGLPAGLAGADSISPLGRALSAKAMTNRFIEAWAECIDSVDTFQVHARWSQRLLEQNGVPRHKIAFVATGLPYRNGREQQRPPRSARGPLRVVFAGRCDPVKGIDVLIEAVKNLEPSRPMTVSFFGPGWEQPFAERLLERMVGDGRFNSPRIVQAGELPGILAQHDVAVVPSIGLETGPLVVLEAFAVGLPVIGSRLGGIAELVRDRVDGVLFEPGDAQALAKILRELIAQPDGLSAMARNVLPPRTFQDVAADMIKLYERLCRRRRQRPLYGN
jgi:glycosyltransferase involved in cell wall biosynthesis